MYIHIYTDSEYFWHSYKNKIHYWRCATIHTRWKQNTEKAVQSSLRAKIHRIFKKGKERKRRKNLAYKMKRKYTTFPNCSTIIHQPTKDCASLRRKSNTLYLLSWFCIIYCCSTACSKLIPRLLFFEAKHRQGTVCFSSRGSHYLFLCRTWAIGKPKYTHFPLKYMHQQLYAENICSKFSAPST